ncbi:beta-phosphoglucomutase family hydrolase [Nocardioides luteus]|uniref:Beta-phosphoglucomutase n=1 Tax=Nocardioides luteus TaxID=1844 RepID=A0ABQ5SV89_9ACTN|nr:beta-phosphoglucomutase family hydrolase [Nocardioides luteus]MDR7309697.1 beta-phosphoglucomutase family hydrolase [Nocardioides luteus]GGR61929.1 haloacid dehalogenase [Nocardioides luteus]GLJ67394.1 haloacid dehalogenase [Nocardioides luteus]
MTRPVAWETYTAILFDLDGVITPTAVVHMQAWEEMFNAYLQEKTPGAPAYTDQDYFAYVDGKPRYDGVRDFLASRDIQIPEGTPEDAPELETVCGLGNRKNNAFNEVLERDGVKAYPGSVKFLDYLTTLDVRLGVVSSSVNAPNVLKAAGLLDRFETVVSGAVADEQGLPGKPAPDTFVYAGKVLGATPSGAVVLEDAVSGVRAGKAGEFALVVGVDRGAGHDVLTAAGASLVVSDLAELIPDGHSPESPARGAQQ